MTYRRKKKRKRRTLNRVLDKMPHFPSMLNAPQDWTLQRKAWRTCHIIPLNVVSPNKAPLELKRNSYITVKQEYISTYYNIPEEREMHVHIIYYNRLTHGVLLSSIKKWTLVYPEKKRYQIKRSNQKGFALDHWKELPWKEGIRRGNDRSENGQKRGRGSGERRASAALAPDFSGFPYRAVSPATLSPVRRARQQSFNSAL